MKRPFFQMACEEPFRLFFPLGILTGISGVMLWPLYFTGIHQFYPGVMHARLMVEGFLAAFIFGFLGTAGPRLTGAPHLSRRELLTALALYTITLGSHIAQYHWIGDAFFLCLLVVYAVFLGRRFLAGKSLPPPGFALVGLGFFCAVVGAVCLVAGQAGLASPRLILLGGTFLNEIWILLLVLGVGSFLLPRILQVPAQITGLRTLPGWRRQAAWTAGVGAVIVALFVLDAFVEAPRLTALARFLVAGGYFLSQIRLHQGRAPRVTITQCLYLSMLFILLGLLFPLGWPLARVAGLHVIFIGGFGLITLTVATRVVFGHGGFESLFHKKLLFLGATALLFLAATALRTGADLGLPDRGGSISLAAYLWMAGAFLWGWKVLPKVRLSGSE